MLDLAAGSGRHTRLLLDAGFMVCAVDRDISELLPFAGERCEVRRIDLETGTAWPLGDGYDGIVVTNYLHRPLLPSIASSLAPGGSLIYESFARGNERFGRPRNPDFLLRPGELLEAFAMLTPIAFEQGEVAVPRPAVIQRLAAVAGPCCRLPAATDLGSAPPEEQPRAVANAAEKPMSLEEYLAWEREQPERYEYSGGIVKMMPGRPPDHSTIASYLWTGDLRLTSIGVEASLGSIDEDTELDATRPREGGQQAAAL